MRVDPHFDKEGGRADEEKRVERREDALIEPEEHFNESDEKRNHTLTPFGTHCSSRVSNHEEDEKLIFRPRNRRNLGEPRIARDPGAHDR